MPKKSESAVETLTFALDQLPKNTGIFLLSCDCFGFFDKDDFEKLTAFEDTECVVFSFKKSLLQTKLANQHTTIKTEHGLVTDVDIKNKKDLYQNCLGGFFWFRNTDIVKEAIEGVTTQKTETELHIDHLIKYMCKTCYPKFLLLDQYIHLGTPSELEEYIYWTNRGASLFNETN
jgi:hypothetical protein